MAVLGVLLVSAVPLWLLWSAVCLFNNVQRAKSSGLHVVISPISAQNPVWLVFQGPITAALRKLPFVDAEAMIKLSKRGWAFFDRYQMHQKYGKVFAHATPSAVEFFVADAASSDELLSRRKDFPKPMDMVQIINLFGPTVASTHGPDWSRHRRITATPFNEANNRTVWSDSVRQTAQLLAYYNDRVGPDGSTALADDAMTLTLHILASAGLGFSYDFHGSQDKAAAAKRSDGGFRDCLAAVLDQFLIMALLPKTIWSLPWLPRKLRDFAAHKAELKRHMEHMVEQTRRDVAASGQHASNLLGALVQKNEEARRQLKSTTPDARGGGSSSSSKKGLSDPELYGNLFVYTFAGHETTAHALGYAMYFLAAYPAVQDWVAAEVARVLGDVDGGLDAVQPRYDALWPRLKRCLAVMLETLRLYPPVLGIPKTTGARAARLPLGDEGTTLLLPPGAAVFPNVVALQSHPDYWGADSLAWRPGRWIDDVGEEDEALRGPPVKGCFIPWGDGPRVCPGRKFSQVEFVAVVASVLWKHRIEVVPAPGEGFAEAKARILDVMDDAAEGVTLFMRNPERVTVRIVER